jgi:hypothetical protein
MAATVDIGSTRLPILEMSDMPEKSQAIPLNANNCRTPLWAVHRGQRPVRQAWLSVDILGTWQTHIFYGDYEAFARVFESAFDNGIEEIIALYSANAP